MIKILFICHGSICRSPLCEYLLRDMAKKRGISDKIHVESAATSREEIGNPIYPPMQKVLRAHGIDPSGHAARQITKADYDEFDYIIGMDEENRYNLLRIFDNDPEGKVSLIMDYTDRPRAVADPWYTRDFDATYRDAIEGVEVFLDFLRLDR